MTIPTWALDACLDDETFAAAYEAVPAQRRALLKTAIARQYAWWAPADCDGFHCVRTWTQGFESLERTAPVRVRILLFDDSCASPALLLAGLLPALTAGAGTTLVVHVREEQDPVVPDGVLAACELAGQEAVAELSRSEVHELCRALARGTESCAILALGRMSERVPPDFADGFQRRVRSVAAPAGIAVLLDGTDQDADLAALAFAHPGARFWVAGSKIALPDERFRYLGANFDDLFATAASACFVPRARAEEALERFPLVFSAGHEACWLLPDLGTGFFQIRGLAWRSPEERQTEDE
ncbi:MAG: hypothetical protein AB7E32_16360 [Desulfovibrio sp.]